MLHDRTTATAPPPPPPPPSLSLSPRLQTDEPGSVDSRYLILAAKEPRSPFLHFAASWRHTPSTRNGQLIWSPLAVTKKS